MQENEWVSQVTAFDTLDFKALDPILQVRELRQSTGQA